MDLEKAVRERLIAELQKSEHSQTLEHTPNRSIGVITDDIAKDNTLVREGIVREHTKSSNKVISCNVKDASSQTYTNNNKQVDGSSIEQRLIDIERECEQRMRKQLNEQLKISAKKHAIESMSRTRRKHKEECRLLENQLRQLEESLEKERLERATANSELELLHRRMREWRDKQYSDSQKIESELRNAVRERDKYKLMSANLQDTHNDMEKKLHEQKTAKEKAVSALEQKTSEAIALRSLLKQCQSALESVSFRPTTIDEDPRHNCRREDHGYVAAIKPNPIVTSADNGINSIEKKLKSTLKDPPCTSTKDPPAEEFLPPSTQSLDYTLSSIDTLVPHEIGVDFYSNRNSSDKTLFPMQEVQLNAASTSQQVGGAEAERDEPVKPEPGETQNDKKKLSADSSPTTTKTTTKDKILTTAEEEPIELQKGGSSNNSSNNSMESESTNGTDDYSMSFHSLKSHKRDEKGRVQYLHIL